LAVLLPNVRFLLYLYVRKEALVSSQIEGTQSSFADVLLFENKVPTAVPKEDVEEVSNYVAAMQHGLRRLQEGFPLSLRLIREIHAILLKGARGENKNRGEFRRSQNWIGGSRPGNASFVPPPPAEMPEALDRFERFMHDDKHGLPLLVEAALVHVQFESIHPFLDGNGRLGRLLITLLLCAKGALKEPLLYLSLYFKKNRNQYYELLQRIRTEGAWEEWLEFFLEGIAATAREAADTATRASRLVFQRSGKDTKTRTVLCIGLARPRIHAAETNCEHCRYSQDTQTLDSHSYGGPQSPDANRDRRRSHRKAEGSSFHLFPLFQHRQRGD
jgi:Fic family protein